MGVYDFDLESYIGLARRLGTDTERVEVKAAAQGLPKSMAETLSAFSNTSGGVVVLGLAERAGFQAVPGFKARAVADALAQMCGEKMEPPVRASVEIVEFEGSPVVVATVPELPPELKPCFVKSRAMHDGSYARVGDGDRRLSPYEVDRLLEGRRPPHYDREVVEGAAMGDFDEELLEGFMRRQRADSPRAFKGMSDEELLGRVQELKIMSRARPLDKQRLVKLLQQRGEVVAVTGDGTNDAPALNFANVGLSMGSGTSVAKDASDITLQDDSFASIATAVMWGRSLYRNIQRFVLFQLTINFAAITICFIGALFGTDMPLTVVQILWVNIIMDTFAAMAMASLPPNPEVMRDKPRPRDEFIITPAMARTLFTCGAAMVVVLLGMLFRWTILQGGLTVEQLTVFFSTFVFLQFWNMFNAKGFETRHSVFTCLGGCREFFLILAAIGVGQVLIVEFGGEVFRTEPLSWMQWAEVIGFTSLLAVGGEIIRAIHRKRKQLR